MTGETLNICLSLLSAMSAPSQPWNDAAAALYTMAMEGWSDEIALKTVKHCCMTERFRPAPVDLRNAAVKLASSAPPSLPVLVADVRRIIVYHGTPEDRRIAAAKCHPLVAMLVDSLGGWGSVGLFRDGTLPDAMARALPGVVKEWQYFAAADQGVWPALEERQMGGEDFTLAPNVEEFIRSRRAPLMLTGVEDDDE